MDPLISTILLWPTNYVPANFAECNGQNLQISQNQALYALIGAIYGGDGKTYFSLPDLRNRIPVGGAIYYNRFGEHGGPNPPGGPSAYIVPVSGTSTGAITLSTAQLPPHTHTATFSPNNVSATASIAIPAAITDASTNIPGTSAVLAKGVDAGGTDTPNIYSNGAATTSLKPFQVNIPSGTGTVAVGSTGSGSQIPVSVSASTLAATVPYLRLSYIIAIIGIWPDRP